MRTLLFVMLSACATKSTETTTDDSDIAELPSGAADGEDVDPGDDDDDTPPEDDDTPADQGTPEDDDTPPEDDDDTPPEDDDDATPEDDDDDTPSSDILDLSVPGPTEVYVSSGSHTTTDGCTLRYERFTPYAPTADGEVFVLHGFMRSLTEFSEIAEHIASWGITTTTVTMCHSSFIDIQPEQNAADVVELADHLGAPSVVWMGHSNGGVSALMAGAMEPDFTEAVLGWDPVEALTGGGPGYAADLAVPLAGLFGESDASCNSSNSGLPVYSEASDVRLLRVTEADHCNFEAPTNWACELTCARDKVSYSDEMITNTIFSMSTAWALGHLEDGFDMTPWWAPGGEVQVELRSAGALSSL